MTAYHDLDSPQDMRSDAAAAQSLLPSARGLAFTDDYTDLYAEFPTDRPKKGVEIDEATRRLAAAIYLD